MARLVSSTNVTVASSGDTSTSLTMELDRIPLAIITPATLDSTTIKFEASDDGGSTWRPVYDEATEYSVAVSASQARHVALKRQPFETVTLIRLKMGSTETAARTLKIRSGLP